jgi:glycosyltransferase involved in cell wall biosynthesis
MQISPPHRPVVSVVMANRNGAAFLAGALVSAQRQSLRDLEIIVCDDASSDDSVDLVTAMMREDPRIRLIRNEVHVGPGAARNKALPRARGEWIAVMDGDDLMHPDRLARLVDAAVADGADMIADDLVMFYADAPRPSHRLLTGRWRRTPSWVEAADYVRLNQFYGSGPALGYLKPLFKASLFADAAMSYDESLSIGEDYDLVLRLLHKGARLRVYPEGLYYYRKHRGSTSHRLNEGAVAALLAANSRFLGDVSSRDPRLRSALIARRRSLVTALAYERLLTALKRRDWLRAFGIAVTSPRAATLLRMPLVLRLRRLLPWRAQAPEHVQVKWESAADGNCEAAGR